MKKFLTVYDCMQVLILTQFTPCAADFLVQQWTKPLMKELCPFLQNITGTVARDLVYLQFLLLVRSF
jgi:hypothetical protein